MTSVEHEETRMDTTSFENSAEDVVDLVARVARSRS